MRRCNDERSREHKSHGDRCGRRTKRICVGDGALRNGREVVKSGQPEIRSTGMTGFVTRSSRVQPAADCGGERRRKACPTERRPQRVGCFMCVSRWPPGYIWRAPETLEGEYTDALSGDLCRHRTEHTRTSQALDVRTDRNAEECDRDGKRWTGDGFLCPVNWR
jgi:hypothetical protein